MASATKLFLLPATSDNPRPYQSVFIQLLLNTDGQLAHPLPLGFIGLRVNGQASADYHVMLWASTVNRFFSPMMIMSFFLRYCGSASRYRDSKCTRTA